MGVNSNGTVMMDQGVFENLGSVTWDTTAKTTGFTAVSGNGYFVNTTSGAITVTLPSSPSAGDVVGIKDYANTADTNAIIIGRNGSNIDGTAADFQITTEGLSALLVYVDATKGWLITNSSQASDISQQALFTVATGGTITTSGDFKIHTFTGPGTFCVSQVGNCVGGPSNVDYLVVAGGGGGGNGRGGGGGAGGNRTTFPSPSCNAGSFPITATAFPITVGGGGANGGTPSASSGSNSIFSSITSAGGGGGGSNATGIAGGSGGGGAPDANPGGAGNTPPVSPPQGNPGGASGPGSGGTGSGGGGGASASGGAGSPPSGGPGGNGTANSINASSVTRSGGGGGGLDAPGSGSAGSGGSGGGGAGVKGLGTATSGTVNTGGGGGGAGGGPSGSGTGGSGGSGIVIIRYKYQ